MKPFNFDHLEETPLEIYFKYYYLDAKELSDFLTRLNKLYERTLSFSYPVYYSEKYKRPFRNFMEIESINTGQSINIKFKEGWKPEFKLEKDELKVKIPMTLGVPVLILSLLLNGAVNYSNFQKNNTEKALHELNIKIKQLELYEKIQDHRRINGSTEIGDLRENAKDTINTIIFNQNIYYIQINGLTIKE